MNTLWSPTLDQAYKFKISEDDTKNIRDSLYKWSMKNSYSLHNNWRSGLILFFLLLIILLFGLIGGSCMNTRKHY